MTSGWIRLGQRLMEKGLLSQRDLVRALMNQLIYGGRLGTNLVELSLTSIGSINAELAEQWRVAPWPADGKVDRAATELLSPQAALELLVIPATVTANACSVILMDPSHERIKRVEDALNRHVTPFVAPELRVRYFLERYFEINRPARFLRLPDGAARNQSERRRYLAPSVAVEQPLESPPWEVPRTTTAGGTPAATASLAQRLQAIETARSGADIARRLVDPLCMQADFNILFWVRGGMAVGCNAWGVSASLQQLQEIVISLDSPSILRHAYQNRTTVHCAPDALHDEITALLGVKVPKDICVAPVLLDDHVVNIISVCSMDSDLPESIALELEAIAKAAGTAYERLRERIKVTPRDAIAAPAQPPR